MTSWAYTSGKLILVIVRIRHNVILRKSYLSFTHRKNQTDRVSYTVQTIETALTKIRLFYVVLFDILRNAFCFLLQYRIWHFTSNSWGKRWHWRPRRTPGTRPRRLRPDTSSPRWRFQLSLKTVWKRRIRRQTLKDNQAILFHRIYQTFATEGRFKPLARVQVS